uniref:RNA polymerase Rpb6 n=1 Tax=viral metagenome TaxID=1070528 RepID=A0A6C0I712_9ZZZZ
MFGGKPKGSESDDDEDELVSKNTRINSATGAALPDEVVSESDAESNAESKTDDSSDADTDADTVTSMTTDASGESELTLDEDDEIAIETPAMIAKKTATAASALANSDSKKKTTKRVVKGKATLQDITTLQQSYDDLELNEDGDTNDSEGDDDDIDDGTNYLRKFDSEMRENYIATYHHEMMQLNMAEVDSLVRVVRNADGMIVDGIHKTMPFLTKYEKTRILGQRAKQLNQGAQPVIPIDKKIIDGYLIAQLEMQQKALPFIIRRPLPGGKSEYWRLADLELI